MFERKHTLSLSLFLFFVGSLIFYSFSSNWDRSEFKGVELQSVYKEAMEESYFKDVLFYIVENKKPSFMLKAKELTLNKTKKKTFVFDPEGHAFSSSGEKIYYSGKKGIYDQKAGILNFEDDTMLRTQTTQARAKKMSYDLAQELVSMFLDVKTKTFYENEGDWIFLDSDKAKFRLNQKKSKYTGNVEGKIKRKKVYEDSLEFKSNELKLDMVKMSVDLRTDVWIKKRDFSAESRRGEIFLDNYNKKLKYFVMYDDIRVSENVKMDGKMIIRKAFSEKLEGMPSEGKIILTGYPKVYQLKDTIKGNMIVLRENTDVVEVDDANTKFNVD